MIQRTLVLLKPDAVQRCFCGEIITRFERAGLKIVGLKMVWADLNKAGTHYGEDITKRRGEHVRNKLLKFITQGPIVAMVLEGVDSVEVVRKLVGGTEPKAALPGTIRGDYSHLSYTHADEKNAAVPNLIHASGNAEEAKIEIDIWFKKEELHSYKTVHDIQTILE